ncbi:LuxR family transcriptional regulator [Streptomyces corchorusii]|uniref:LuxR family transcriptional regulator n=2 Tax=Streptomyces TaxID=1883 RepID=A0A101PUR3_STRCK|nr:helix-turn-helix transcriptional regulator [Streptomyces corchorusii]KUN18037.1 LuxR family transcriptional regulator [Streptomyces corchorusii]
METRTHDARGAHVGLSLSGLDEEQRDALSVALGLPPGHVADGTVVARAHLLVLRHEAAGHPLLLTADDPSAIRRQTRTALEVLAHEPPGSRAGPDAGSRSPSADVPGLLVRPGDEEAADRLLHHAFPAMPLHQRRHVLAGTGRTPLALLRLPDAPPAVRFPPVEALPEVVPLTEGVEALFGMRVGRLPAATRAALLLAALEGEGDMHVLRGAEGDAARAALEAAETAQLVEVDDEAHRVLFRHPLVRSAVVGSSTRAERRRAHRVLAGLVGDPDRRAWHRAEACATPDEPTAALLEKTAHRTVRRGDATAAVTALVRAADLSPHPADQSRRLAEAAYLGASVTGELENASDLLRRARTVATGGRGSLHAAAATALVLLEGDGTVETAYRLVVDAIEEGSHGYDATDSELIDALSTLLAICGWAGRAEYWPPLLRAIDRLVPEPPEELRLLREAVPDPARAPQGTRGRLAALVRNRAAGAPGSLVRVDTAAVFLDLLADGRAGAWQLVESGRAGHAVAGGLAGFVHLCLDDFVTGRWEEGRRLADEGLALARAHGYAFTGWYFLFHLALLAAARGDEAGWTSWADELTHVTTLRRAHGAARFAHHARALGALGQGDFEAAYHHLCEVSPAGALAPNAPNAAWVALDLVEAALRTNRRAQAEAHVRAMAEARSGGASPRFAMLTLAARALVAPDAEALLLFRAAVDSPGARDWPFDHARVRLLYGERLRRLRMVTESRHHLGAATETFRRLGAAPWAARSATELRAAGRPRSGPAADSAAADGAAPAGLTSQEMKVAFLAAEGLTNKQIGERLFLSSRTISTHLYRIFPKLGISSRAALRDALSHLGATADDMDRTG